jgi:hypothetical protein
MSDHRGVYRGIYAAMLDDADFQALPAVARHVLLTLRLCPQNNAASVFRMYPAVVSIQTGYPIRVLRGALAALVKGRWVECDGPWETLTGPCVVWIRNGLRYDPNLRLADRKHRIAVERALAAFGASPLVVRFCEYYKITRPFEDPSETHRSPFEGSNRFGSPSTSTSTSTRTRKGGVEERRRDARSTQRPEGFSPHRTGDTKDGRTAPAPPDSAGDAESFTSGRSDPKPDPPPGEDQQAEVERVLADVASRLGIERPPRARPSVRRPSARRPSARPTTFTVWP